MIESGEINPLKMVSHRVALEELDTVYHKFDNREDGIQKVCENSTTRLLGDLSLTQKLAGFRADEVLGSAKS